MVISRFALVLGGTLLGLGIGLVISAAAGGAIAGAGVGLLLAAGTAIRQGV